MDSLSPVCRLPIEILEPIFIHCACDYHNDDSGYPTQRVPSWVNISYVCRHWRNVALNCPTLWAYLFVMSPRWTAELLSRSKQAPLKLHVNPDEGSRALSFVVQVMSHVERIQELHLHLPFVGSGRMFFSRLSSPAPRLQILKISATELFSRLPSMIFHGDTPALRTLELTGCSVPSDSFQLRGLTTLSLRRVPIGFRQDMMEMLATLKCMQDLTHLYLDRALTGASGFLSSAALDTMEKIDLPHLSRLWIVAPLSSVIAFMSCFNIPLKTEVKLECHFDFPLHDYTPLSSLLAHRFNMSDNRASPKPTIHSLVVDLWWGSETLAFSASDRDCDFTASTLPLGWDCNIPLQIIVQFGQSMVTGNIWRDRDFVMSKICSSIPLTDVQSLHVINPPFSSAFWRKILGLLPNLRYLKLSQGCMPDLAPVLFLTPHDYMENGGYTDRGPAQVLAPVLDQVELYDILFLALGGVTMDSPAADAQSLFDALCSRKGSRGRLTAVKCVIAMYDHDVSLDMVGRWDSEGGFHVTESV